MRILPRMEEIILIAIWRLKDNASGITIRAEVAKATRKEWALGAIYPFLSRLHHGRYVMTVTSRATKERRGQHKILCRLTDTGREALAEVRQIHERI